MNKENRPVIYDPSQKAWRYALVATSESVDILKHVDGQGQLRQPKLTLHTDAREVCADNHLQYRLPYDKQEMSWYPVESNAHYMSPLTPQHLSAANRYAQVSPSPRPRSAVSVLPPLSSLQKMHVVYTEEPQCRVQPPQQVDSSHPVEMSILRSEMQTMERQISSLSKYARRLEIALELVTRAVRDSPRNGC